MTTPAFPATSSTLMLAGPAGQLEVAVDLPEGEVTPLPLTVVLCHPLSTEGGSLNNKVVTMAARSLRELGANTVRFNFRGVGNSEGPSTRAMANSRTCWRWWPGSRATPGRRPVAGRFQFRRLCLAARRA